MENDPSRRRESISLTPVAKGLENMGADFLESLEEGQLPRSDLSPAEIRSSWSEAAPKPFSRWRNLQPALRARSFCREHMQLFRWIGTGLLCTGLAAFLLVACLLDFQRALALFVLTCVVLTFLGHRLLKRLLGPKLRRFLKPQGHPRLLLWFKRGLALAAFLGLVLWLSLDTSQRPEQLVSFAGICVFIALLFACSKHHCAVSWRAVSWGLGLQFVLGLLVIRTEPGFIAFEWLGEQIRIFLSYTKAGSSFVFGEALVKDVFAFQVLPIIVFFSCVISILYHVGLMQWVILKIAWLMQVTMGTTATETLSVAGNIFVSQTEAPLLIRPYLADMTLSEVHVVMTGGYATIAGSLLGAYISFGIDATSLIAASVMAAPCALALSKLVYPEVEESKFRREEGVKLTYGDAQNLIEAASTGAAISVKVVANIAANLIAFLAVLDFINAALSWLGDMVDVQGLSFQLICSYILRPVAFLMGVAWEDCPVVAELLGIKLFLNEFVAYQDLSKYKQRRLAGAEEWVGDRKQWISVRAEVLTTFALCGFANFSSIGIMLGGLTSMVPQRKSDFSQIVLRALFTGACVSLVNACMAASTQSSAQRPWTTAVGFTTTRSVHSEDRTCLCFCASEGCSPPGTICPHLPFPRALFREATGLRPSSIPQLGRGHGVSVQRVSEDIRKDMSHSIPLPAPPFPNSPSVNSQGHFCLLPFPLHIQTAPWSSLSPLSWGPSHAPSLLLWAAHQSLLPSPLPGH
ncbi:sodium/nucleoside cotransporter 1 isoform X5 [Pan troglodytes]|nr:sodium/nucleoside cotransporter 1 isoform X5 [Pan troglodytes]XP_009428021.1 sodium/nucleoside cotransporter 1 isoform X5 [Pan troglodytes]XP_009428022.1 sodium/nucleoside cotransporter 1 isoform X5 [Pan troglodytes]XP_054523863.1 sodium/nucleoside cotransporter 1 isoform X5 [Pan troglodytes]